MASIVKGYESREQDYREVRLRVRGERGAVASQ